MGRADAEARRDELLAFFGDPADDEREGDAEAARDVSASAFPPSRQGDAQRRFAGGTDRRPRDFFSVSSAYGLPTGAGGFETSVRFGFKGAACASSLNAAS